MEKKKMCANHNSNAAPKKGNESNAKRECTTYKYSTKGNGQLHEAVMLSGRPVFLKCESDPDILVEFVINPLLE